ncbi:hypothetical protein DL766_004914 [Monosporascus sp. MC13-8B]|uniref:HSF-type DNA-binding domain-containing protein n=1 Tax=Monosporascus cannonballus TaxID=155416 RepID=A0ABY0HGB1_9PEZI|nr:hypothetical protein DL763_010196 [Monosporascus cannonballus]RYO92784.1 hypothetical protein DL762_001490 [Monosporascus cannonballus]RYP30313.1 hypothetical protein DL766_004914 [Monosporascus sp. MC13-8B]
MSSPNPNLNPRKRPAPGSIPMPQPMPQSYNPPDPLLRWNGNNVGNLVDNGSNNVNPYGVIPSPTQAQYPQNVPAQSTALARRDVNNALVARTRSFSPQQNGLWPNYTDDTMNLNAANGGTVIDEHDNIELLEERAQRAKREAQAKRKQIPPFVQKLNSFLEESKNTDLIRWSEKGDSFIVLDEDEFAKTLIPELFKHNNYASFVRQLNMYGFHKKVGLSDNSMKASERKNKSPSEYYNPYFRRGHPNLLWLINKPKSGNSKKSKKRGEEVEGDSDEDGVAADDSLGQGFPQHTTTTRALSAPESGPLQKKELALVRDQMATLQQQQKTISAAIAQLRQEHNELYRQALAFQTQHDRHENSINAILNFLANVFRKSLEEQGGVQNVNDLLASILPNAQIPQAQQSGTVVDLGDWSHQQGLQSTAQVGTPKRTPRLLPGIPQNPVRKSPSTTPAPTAYVNHTQTRMGSVTELVDTPTDESTPAFLKHELEANPQEGMMKLIQSANTKSRNPATPFTDVAAHTSPTMTNDQRDRMLSIMSNGTNGTSPQSAGFSASTPAAQAMSPATAVSMPTNGNISATGASSSLSPILSSTLPTTLPSTIHRISQTQEDLEKLQRLQEEQNQKIENLSSLLGPLSPSGRIPGLEDSGYFPNDSDVDLTQFLDSSAYTDGNTAEFDFNTSSTGFDGTTANYDWGTNDPVDFAASGSAGGAFPGLDGDRTVETHTTPSQRSPSTAGTEDVPQEDLVDSPGRSAKRQRMA